MIMRRGSDQRKCKSSNKLAALGIMMCLPVIAQEPLANDLQPEDGGNYEVCAAHPGANVGVNG